MDSEQKDPKRRGKVNMKRRRLPAAAVLLAVLSGLGGCGIMEDVESLVPEKAQNFETTTLVAYKDGTIRETVVDTLDESYYNSEDLKKMIDETVSAYCADNGEAAVVTDNFTVEENRVVLGMTYKSAADYAAYNNVYFFNGPMLQAQMDGYLFNHDFYKVEEGAAAQDKISAEEPLSHKEYSVLVTDASHVVRVPGEIRYVSANAKVQDAYTMVPGEPEESTEQVLVLPSSAVYVQEKSSDETAAEADRALIYILYDF